MNPAKHAYTVADRKARARLIAKSLGIRYGAAYLRQRGISLSGAMFVLLGRDGFRKHMAREKLARDAIRASKAEILTWHIC